MTGIRPDWSPSSQTMNDKKPTPLHPGWLAGDTEEPSDADYRLVFAEVEKRIAGVLMEEMTDAKIH